MNENKQVDHLSYSAVSTYLTCPLRYRFHYIDQIPAAFTSSSLAFGSAVHEAVGAFYQTHLEGDSLRIDQMVDVYRQAWMSRNREEIRFFNGDNENSLLEKAQQLLTVFHDSFDPSVSVLGVEEFFELPLGGIPTFQGYIDLIEQSADGTVSIVDLKTASKKLTNANVQSNVQLTAYSLGAEALGFDPRNLSLRLDVLLKTKSPEMARYETRRSDADRYRFIKVLYQVWNGIEQGIFFPREDWHCQQCAWASNCTKW
jgi:putative RecB family exonuclease